MNTHPLSVGSTLKNKYTITQLVAGGGMAWVYRAEERLSDGTIHIWAIKELRPAGPDRRSDTNASPLFQQEAHILAQLRHRNLPQVAAFFEERGRLYLVMEFVAGESLQRRLKDANAPLLEDEVLDWAIQICNVLDYLHSRHPPVIFRDLKPSNVMVTPDGTVKLIDFGIARTFKAGKLRDTIAMGSENYAAPEQWGIAQTDARTDIYGLGATMYHLLTNVPPTPAFVPTDPVPLRQYNPAVSQRLAAMVDKAMAHDRQQRYPTAADMQADLLNCRPGLSHPARTTRPGRYAQANTQSPTHRPQPRKRCPSCQTGNRVSARFCRRCGRSFVGALPARLRVLQPQEVTWEMPLDSKHVLIGRRSTPEGFMPDLDLDFYDPCGFVSRRHARITRQGTHYEITDLDSHNGTYINSIRLRRRAPHVLCQGDRIQVGKIVLEFAVG